MTHSYFLILLDYTSYLIVQHVREAKPLQKATTVILRSHRRKIRFLDKEIEWVNTHLEKSIHAVAEWQKNHKILGSTRSIRNDISYTLLG